MPPDHAEFHLNLKDQLEAKAAKILTPEELKEFRVEIVDGTVSFAGSDRALKKLAESLIT